MILIDLFSSRSDIGVTGWHYAFLDNINILQLYIVSDSRISVALIDVS